MQLLDILKNTMNVDDVKYAIEDLEINSKTNNNVSNNVKYELMQTFVNLKQENLKLYLQCLRKALMIETFGIVLPGVILASSINYLMSPKKMETRDIYVYKRIESSYDGTGATKYEEEMGNIPYSYEFADDNYHPFKTLSNSVEYYLMDSKDGIKAKLDCASDNRLVLNKIEKGFYTTDDILLGKEVDYVDNSINEEYDKLIDDIYEFLLASDIDQEYKDILKQINASAEKKVLINTVFYEKMGSMPVDVIPDKAVGVGFSVGLIILSIICLLYVILDKAYILDGIRNKNGKLIYTDKKIIFGYIKEITKEFINSEYCRIKLSSEKLDEILEQCDIENCRDLFTSFEANQECVMKLVRREYNREQN